MYQPDQYPVFESISKRAAHSHIRSLSRLAIILPSGLSPQEGEDMEASQRDLHAFFQAMYNQLFQAPDLFGLPLVKDAYIEGYEKNITQLKQELNRKLQKPRDLIAFGLDFLLMLGNEGSLEGKGLALGTQAYSDFLKTAKKKKQFITGLQQSTGLVIAEDGSQVIFCNSQFPAMMPALKALAAACSQHTDAKQGKLNFSRCDFNSLAPNYHPTALDLYRIFTPLDFQRVERLHEFLTRLDYKPIFQIHGIFGWEVQYQGKKKIKASPLVTVEYSERYRNPLRVNIKCASSRRLIPLIYQQSEVLRKDFISRTYECRGDDCGWCRNRTNVGPEIYDYDGINRKICWYTYPDFDEFNDSSVELIEEYALFHEKLAVI